MKSKCQLADGTYASWIGTLFKTMTVAVFMQCNEKAEILLRLFFKILCVESCPMRPDHGDDGKVRQTCSWGRSIRKPVTDFICSD